MTRMFLGHYVQQLGFVVGRHMRYTFVGIFISFLYYSIINPYPPLLVGRGGLSILNSSSVDFSRFDVIVLVVSGRGARH